jgi:hypothetical protein
VLAAIAGAAASGAPAAAAAALLVSAALLTGQAVPLVAAVVLLGAVFPEDGGVAAPLYAGVLLLLAELAFWALEERRAGRVEPGTGVPRLRGLLAVTAIGVAASALVVLATQADVGRSPAGTAAGLAAILAALGVLGALTRARPPGSGDARSPLHQWNDAERR